MDISNLIIRVLPTAMKNNPAITGFIQENAAKIFFGTGVVLVGAGSVVLAKGSVDGGHIFQQMSDEMVSAKAKLIEAGSDDEIARQEYYAERTRVLKSTGKKALKAYGPGAAIIVAGEVMQGAGFGTVSGQLATTAASLAAAQTFISKVSNRAESKFGKQIRDELFYGGDTRNYKIAKFDENGNAVAEDTSILVSSNPMGNPLTFDFRDSDLFKPNSDVYNYSILQSTASSFAVDLAERVEYSDRGFGYINLYEILTKLGFVVPQKEMAKYLIWGIAASDMDEIDGDYIFTTTDVASPSITTDGVQFKEKYYIIEFRNVVNLYDLIRKRTK